MTNPLLSDRDVEFLLFEVHDVGGLLELPAFSAYSREALELFLSAVRRFARDVLLPSYTPMDVTPPIFEDGRVRVHPRMKALYAGLVELGLLNATRPAEVGGQALPLMVANVASAYVMAGNLSAYAFAGLTSGAAHLIEAFGTPELKARFMAPMYEGRFTGTMALTEPQAGSSLADASTRASAAGDGSWRLKGSKIFISGGDNDFAENVVHLTLARMEGAPPGTRGLSLFAVPRLREEGGRWVDNDVEVTGVIHKIGWRGLPSVVLSYGERDDCHGWLVGEPNRGLAHMFQMMNEARLMVGINATATASVAYQQALAYAQERRQGRAPGERDPSVSPVLLIEHADVRRMLLRQKAIVEGALSLIVATSRYADVAAHAAEPERRARAQLLLDLLTPAAKSFPAERGFEANALALQVYGGYGYSSEYPVEAWLRDQKLNTIHEGTTGIQAMDLLGRKVVAQGGAAWLAFADEVGAAIADARAAGVEPRWCVELERVISGIGELTAGLGATGLQGDVERMLRHSADYLELFSITCIAWQWLLRATAARRGLEERPSDAAFYQGQLAAAQYWFATELTRVPALIELCASGEDSYARMRPEWF